MLFWDLRTDNIFSSDFCFWERVFCLWNLTPVIIKNTQLTRKKPPEQGATNSLAVILSDS